MTIAQILEHAKNIAQVESEKGSNVSINCINIAENRY